ncbi:hypothetical protein [uncultured Megasphaera sp.]|uniref:hypothetical protein n=1 Tax=uncultured Megasphaera sp. TaxID=165188 RepID=UPI00266C57A0|nr:hypothetical protein [uncultured Megasphaera sp.]
MLVQLDGLRPRLLPKALPYPVLSQRIDFGMSLFANRQWGRGTFPSPGVVNCSLPLTCDIVLSAWANDDVGSTEAGVIGWVTSQTDGQQITFGCSKQASMFVYAVICR